MPTASKTALGMTAQLGGTCPLPGGGFWAQFGKAAHKTSPDAPACHPRTFDERQGTQWPCMLMARTASPWPGHVASGTACAWKRPKEVSLLAQVFGENNLFRTRAGGRVRERSLGSGKSSESREDSKGLGEGSGGVGVGRAGASCGEPRRKWCISGNIAGRYSWTALL
jgi:hypothetical protein